MDEKLIQNFMDNVGQLMLLWQRIRRDILIEEGLTPTDKRILYGLLRNGEVTKTKLAELVVLELSSLSRAITRLEKQGLINKVINRQDKRGIKLSLTEKGHDKTTQFRRKVLEATMPAIKIESEQKKKELEMMILNFDDFISSTKKIIKK